MGHRRDVPDGAPLVGVVGAGALGGEGTAGQLTTMMVAGADENGTSMPLIFVKTSGTDAGGAWAAASTSAHASLGATPTGEATDDEQGRMVASVRLTLSASAAAAGDTGIAEPMTCKAPPKSTGSMAPASMNCMVRSSMTKDNASPTVVAPELPEAADVCGDQQGPNEANGRPLDDDE